MSKYDDYDKYDDFEIVNNDLTNHSGLTLTAVVKDEIFFLPAFFNHYRALGVERFILLDDHSTDGTREFLCRQSDCMVLESKRIYNEMVPFDSARKRNLMMFGMWQNLLARKYTLDRWGLHVDADEFLRLPDNVTLKEFISRLEKSQANAVWGVMHDIYPARLSDLKEMASEQTLNLDREWFFDGRPHLVLQDSYPRRVYPGSRARLMRHFRVPIKRPFITRAKILLRRLLSPQFIPFYNKIEKIPLFKLPKDGYYFSNHEPFFRLQTTFILPLEHYRFTGRLFERIQSAITLKNYHEDSIEYRYLNVLLAQMEQEQASFLGPYSTRRGSFQTYVETGIAQGFE